MSKSIKKKLFIFGAVLIAILAYYIVIFELSDEWFAWLFEVPLEHVKYKRILYGLGTPLSVFFFGGILISILRFFGIIADYTPEEKAEHTRQEEQWKKDKYNLSLFRSMLDDKDPMTAHFKAKRDSERWF